MSAKLQYSIFRSSSQLFLIRNSQIIDIIHYLPLLCQSNSIQANGSNLPPNGHIRETLGKGRIKRRVKLPRVRTPQVRCHPMSTFAPSHKRIGLKGLGGLRSGRCWLPRLSKSPQNIFMDLEASKTMYIWCSVAHPPPPPVDGSWSPPPPVVVGLWWGSACF